MSLAYIAPSSGWSLSSAWPRSTCPWSKRRARTSCPLPAGHDPSERWGTCPGPVEENRRGQAAHQISHGLSAELSVDLILKGETDKTGLYPAPCLLPVCCHVQGGFQLGKHGQVASQGSSEQDGEGSGLPNIFIGAGLDGTKPHARWRSGRCARSGCLLCIKGATAKGVVPKALLFTLAKVGQTLTRVLRLCTAPCKVEVRQVSEVRSPAMGQRSKTAKGVAASV